MVSNHNPISYSIPIEVESLTICNFWCIFSPLFFSITDILRGLWINQSPDAQAEITYNKIISKNGNGCAVCAYFDHELVICLAVNCGLGKY